MVSVARKNLFHDKVRFAITLTGITFAVVLIFAQSGVYLGFMENAANYVQNQPVDIWVTSKNCKTFDFALPFSEDKVNEVREDPGILWAEKVVAMWAQVKLPSGTTDEIKVIGFDPNTGIGGPWKMKEGHFRDLKRTKSIIIDESSQRKLGDVQVGDILEVPGFNRPGHRVKLVGISRGAECFTTTLVFTTYKRTQEFFDLWGRASFILARVKPGHDVEAVKARLSRIRGVSVFTSEEFARKTKIYWTKDTGMGIGFGITILLGFIVGMVIVGQTIYSATMEHQREFGTLKAIGATNRQVYGIIYQQALISALVGYVIASVIITFVEHWYRSTGLKMLIPDSLRVAMFFLTILMCLGASVVSIRKVTRIDPMIVFKT